MTALPRTLAIFGPPRSGTSWLGQLLNHHPAVAYRFQPLFAYEFKDWFGLHGVSSDSVRAFHAAILEARSDFVLTDLRPPKDAAPRLLAWKEVRYHGLMAPLVASGALDRLVYLVRDPVDVVDSWYRAPKEFRAGQDIHAEWRDAPSKNVDDSEWNGFARWKESLRIALDLARSHPARVTLVRYERLRADPRATLARLLQDEGLSMAPEVEAFIAASTSRGEDDAYSVFRAGPAERVLPEDIVAALRGDEEAAALLAAAEELAARVPR